MPLKEKDYTNDEGLKDGSLLEEYPVHCGKKAGKNHQHTKRCMQ